MKAARGRGRGGRAGGSRMTLNDRFSSIPKSNMQASRKNQQLAKQMENRPAVIAALSKVNKQGTKVRRGAKVAQAVKVGVTLGNVGAMKRGAVAVRRGGRGGRNAAGQQRPVVQQQSKDAGPYVNSRRPVLGTPQSSLLNQQLHKQQKNKIKQQNNNSSSRRPVTGTPQSALNQQQGRSHQQQPRPQQKTFVQPRPQQKKFVQPQQQQNSRRPVTGTPQAALQNQRPQQRGGFNRGRAGVNRGHGSSSRGGGRLQQQQQNTSIKGRLSIQGRISKPNANGFSTGGRLGGFSSRGRGNVRGGRGRGGFGYSNQW